MNSPTGSFNLVIEVLVFKVAETVINLVIEVLVVSRKHGDPPAGWYHLFQSRNRGSCHQGKRYGARKGDPT